MGNDRFVWSTDDPCVAVTELLRRNNGDVDKALRALFGRSCSYLTARQLSVALAHCFDMTEDEFMRHFKRLRKLTLSNERAL
jgi:hypothetical protein